MEIEASNYYRKVEGDEPRARYGHAAVVLSHVEGGVLILGGADVGGQFLNDVILWDIEALAWRSPEADKMPDQFAKAGRNFHTCASDGVHAWCFGGKANGYHNEILRFSSGHGWQVIDVRGKGEQPSRRFGHASALSVNKQLWYHHGGYDEYSSICNDLYAFELPSLTWKKIKQHRVGALADRMHHTMTEFNGSLFVCGGKGQGSKSLSMEMNIFSCRSGAWKSVPVKPSKQQQHVPSPRWGHSATLINTIHDPCILIFGGRDEKRAFNDLWSFQLNNHTWRKLPIDAAVTPEPRFFHSATLISGVLHLFGGRDMKMLAFGSLFKIEFHRCYMSLLSRDALMMIFRFLDPVTLLSVCQCCKFLNNVASSPLLWKPIFQNYRKYTDDQYAGIVWMSPEEDVDETVDWKLKVQLRAKADMFTKSQYQDFRKRVVGRVKLVMSGDGAVGKTCSLISFTTNTFPSEYVPTVFDNYSKCFVWGKKFFMLGLWDTNGGEDYDRLRPLSYPQTDVFMIHFSCVSPSSFRNVSAKWVPEIRHHCPDVPIVIAATKIDLRGDQYTIDYLAQRNLRIISTEEGRQLAANVGADAYVEYSALTQEGIHDAYRACVQIVLGQGEHRPRPDKHCADKHCALF